jgi:hypothetical protein
MGPKRATRSSKGKAQVEDDTSNIHTHTIKSRRLTFKSRNRKLLKAKFCKLHTFPAHSFLFPAQLASAAVTRFVSDHGEIFPDLVREFYHNFKLTPDEFGDITLTSHVLSTSISLTVEEFGDLLHIPHEGLVLVSGVIPHDWLPYNKAEIFIDMCRPHQQNTARQQLLSSSNLFGSNLSVSDRMLHLIIAYILFPKNSNHSRINEFELMVLNALRRRCSINWALSIMYHMQLMQSLDGGLPYARAISHILDHAGVNLQREVTRIQGDKEVISDATALKNTGIILDARGHFHYKEDFEPTVQYVAQPPEGGYTLDMLFNQMTLFQRHVDDRFDVLQQENASTRRQLRNVQRTQKLILEHLDRTEVQDEEVSGSGSGSETGSEDNGDEMNEDED